MVYEPLDLMLCYSALRLLSTGLPLLRSGLHGAVVGRAATEVDGGNHHKMIRVSFDRECGLGVYDCGAHSTSVYPPDTYVVWLEFVVPCDTVVCVRYSNFARLKKVFMIARLLSAAKVDSR